MADNTQLTPQNIPTTSFQAKADEYGKILSAITEQETAIATNQFAMQELFAKYDVAVRFKDVEDYTGLEDKLTIYMPEVKVDREGLVYTAAKAEGRAFSEIVSNPPLLKALEKRLGHKFLEFFREVDDVFHQKEITKEREEDKVKTAEIKVAYAKIASALMKAKITLKQKQQELKNVEQYIAFCKTIAALAPATPQKGSGDKGQQQQPKPQN